MFISLSNGKISVLLSFIRSLVLIVIFVKLFVINGLWYALLVAELFSLIISLVLVKKYKKVYNY